MKRHAETEKEALLRAADLLEAEGWCQFFNRNEEGQRCIAGALSDVINVVSTEPLTVHQLRTSLLWNSTIDLLKTELDVANIASLVSWNDTLGRTQQEVVDLLRRVASTT